MSTIKEEGGSTALTRLNSDTSSIFHNTANPKRYGSLVEYIYLYQLFFYEQQFWLHSLFTHALKLAAFDQVVILLCSIPRRVNMINIGIETFL